MYMCAEQCCLFLTSLLGYITTYTQFLMLMSISYVNSIFFILFKIRSKNLTQYKSQMMYWNIHVLHCGLTLTEGSIYTMCFSIPQFTDAAAMPQKTSWGITNFHTDSCDLSIKPFLQKSTYVRPNKSVLYTKGCAIIFGEINDYLISW